MTFSQPFRLAALSVACLFVLYAMMVLFQSNDRPWLDGAKMWMPFLIVAVPPYLVVLWRLYGRPTDTVGLGLAIACAAISVALLVAYVVAMARVKEMAPLNLVVGIMFWHITIFTAFFVFVPLQFKLGSSAFTTLGSSGVGRLGLGIGAGAVLAMAYVALAGPLLKPLAAGSSKAAERSEYSQTTATRHLLQLYKCLWRKAGPAAVSGFPATEEQLRSTECWNPTIAPGGSGYGTYYKFRYIPGRPDADGVIRSFALATRKRNAPGSWTDSYYLDHLGVLRRSVHGWATEKTDRIESFKSGIIPEMAGLLDAYHDVHGWYPLRIFHFSERDKAGPHDLVIPERLLQARKTEAAPDGTSVVDTYSARMIYTPVSVNSGRPSAYTLGVRSEYPDNIHDLRSYFVDREGRIHGTGENRDATAADPEAPAVEWAPRVREQTRQHAATVFASRGM